MTRLILDGVAVTSTALAVLLASVQVEDNQIPPFILWLAIALLVVAVSAESVELIRLMH